MDSINKLLDMSFIMKLLNCNYQQDAIVSNMMEMQRESTMEQTHCYLSACGSWIWFNIEWIILTSDTFRILVSTNAQMNIHEQHEYDEYIHEHSVEYS